MFWKKEKQVSEETITQVEQMQQEVIINQEAPVVHEHPVVNEADSKKEVTVEEPIVTLTRNANVGDAYLLTAPEIVGWSSQAEQETLFAALTIFYNSSQSCLDVGCGRADLFGFLSKAINGAPFSYEGIDYNPNILEIAKRKYPNVLVHNTDLLKTTDDVKYDWVFGSGLFNLNEQTDMNEYARICIDKMYTKSNIGTAFNLLTGYPVNASDELKQALILHNPLEWFKYLYNKYNKVIVRTDYLVGDVTFYLIK